jgi:hypothetical protein
MYFNKKNFLYREFVVKERLTNNSGELNLLKNEKVTAIFTDTFNFASKEERSGSIYITNFRFIFIGYLKIFSLSIPHFQIKKVSLKKGSSKKKPLMIIHLKKRAGDIKLAFGIFNQNSRTQLEKVKDKAKLSKTEIKASMQKLKEINKTITSVMKKPMNVKTFGIYEEILKNAIQSQK